MPPDLIEDIKYKTANKLAGLNQIHTHIYVN